MSALVFLDDLCVRFSTLLDQLSHHKRNGVLRSVVLQIELIPLTRVPQILGRMSLQLAATHEKRPPKQRIHDLHESRKQPPLSPPRINNMLTYHHPPSRLQ